ncbi:preprotein translocase subunit SecY [Caldalkalibacillus salinus]|uniref:preprotein translocase subunit SecY n=1 Tax=Caldalkalibacillus salinus TaxID=2803787 RepID=UPI0019229031|nr:preprotein translocase subunit SecY [Caldalkalibacillus salinus]
MFATISNILKIDDLRQKIVFTLLMLVVFRIGAFIPVPNINAEALALDSEMNALTVFNVLGGGALQRFSIFAMGIMPYITASIIVQLLTMDVVPKFAQWAREGEAGKRKLAQFTRYGTIVLGFIQAIGMSIGFNTMTQGALVMNPGFTTYLFIALVLTAGTAFLMWLGEQITEKGIGNGISIIIFAGIVAGFPTGINQLYAVEMSKIQEGANPAISILTGFILLLVIVAITVGVIYVQQGIRKIPVQYAKRVVGRKMYGGQSTHIPLKVNAAGVIPVIFAMSLIIFPSTIASFWSGNAVADWITANMHYTSGLGMFFYVLLIIGFTYFYTFVQINPLQMAENMKKNGGYIPGIRPGKTTSVYLTRILNRITLAGALFLAAVSILPFFISALSDVPPSVQIGGTALLIVVGVALDTMRQVNSQLIKRHYKGFIK